MERKLNIYIGYDSREVVAFHTLVQSIIKHTSIPFTITPLNIDNLPEFARGREDGSTEFSFTRFLVPYLSGYEGISLFMDCDMLVTHDLKELLDLDKDKAIHVVKHEYTPKQDTKFLGNKQVNYPRKNWSSFVVWNCSNEYAKILTPHVVNSAKGEWLHRFSFIPDSYIGSLGVEWNWLVGEYEYNGTPVKNIHWTNGGPYFNEYSNVDFSLDWNIAFKDMCHVTQTEDR